MCFVSLPVCVPLAAPKNNADGAKTREISRSHKLVAAPSGLVTITGGKWTTYRRMAEDTVNMALKTKGLTFRKCRTKNLKIHGYLERPGRNDHMYIYGSDCDNILMLQEEKRSTVKSFILTSGLLPRKWCGR